MTPQQKLMRRLLAVYGAPQTEDPEMFLEEFERAIAKMDGRILEDAGTKALAECRFFPRPSEIVAFCRQVAPISESTPQQIVDYDTPPPSPESVQRVRSMLADCVANLTAAGLPKRSDRPLSRKDLAAGERE